ncbi:MAG TPA: redoxin domain-containing protein [Terriglobia bacterium]|nr:redoxin domain-containing protein [Terriglobia bacterium]
MKIRMLYLLLLTLVAMPVLAAEEAPPTLAIGAKAPDFCLPGIDDQTHCLKDYAASKVLVIVFTCNHCPTAQLYESRIKKLASDYRDRGVELVAIEPNDPHAVRLDEMGYTDVGDSFAEMKIRAGHRQFNFPYLDDGETQKVAHAYGPTATPHVFVFDSERRLRYEGRLDNNPREQYANRHDARDAIEAVLAGQPVAVTKTPSFGCSIKWAYKGEGRKEELADIEREPVTVQLAGADDLRALRKNSTGKLLLVNFWATWCGPCVKEFPEFQAMYRMYRHRPFDLVTVSANYPDAQAAVLRALKEQHASSRNLLFGSMDIYNLMAAFDADWNAAVPYTMLILPNGEIAYKHQGEIDPLELRRMIIANLPDDDYIGHQALWQTK